MAVNLPACPVSLKPIAHYLKTAQEHDARDPVVAYWSRLYALQTGLKLSTKQPEETNLLIGIMEWLEKTKKEHRDNESISNEVVAQAYLENYAHKLFSYADQQDRAANFGKNVVKAFYTAGMIYDILLTFGELSEEAQNNRKYAKFKAAYIHNCLKSGETPVAGPLTNDGEADTGENATENTSSTPVPPLPQPRTIISQNPSPPEDAMGFQPPAPSPAQQSIEYDPNKLPSPPVDPEDKNPGGFKPFDPSQPANVYVPPTGDVTLNAEQMAKAQKYIKWAGSALNYDDVKTAIDNLQKALHLLQTGQEG